MTDTINVSALKYAVRANPRDKAACGALFDLLQEEGTKPLTARKEVNSLRRAALKAAEDSEVAQAEAMVNGQYRDGTTFRTKIRKLLGLANNHPIVIVAGRSKPTRRGHDAYYTTPGGKHISHPNAYKWPKVRHGSTLRAEVGAKWVLARAAKNGLRVPETVQVGPVTLGEATYEAQTVPTVQ